MDSALTTIGLPIALGFVMFGLGLSLTVDDFQRVARQPRAVAVALYSVFMFVLAALWGVVITRWLPASGRRAAPAV